MAEWMELVLCVQKEEAEDPSTDFSLMTKCKRVIKVDASTLFSAVLYDFLTTE